MLSFFKSWKDDLPAGLVVFLVAVPLCLGIALASEAPLFAGLIAGIIGGIVIGAVSGSNIGVSGPAAGLTAIVAAAISDLGAFDIFLLSVVIAGLLQILFGIFRGGFISAYIPNAVIKGMLAAIGIIIILKQLPHAVGYDRDYEGDESFFQFDGENTFTEIYRAFVSVTAGYAITITLISILLLIVWDRKIVQRTFLRFIPGPLVVVIAGIVLTNIFQGTTWQLSADHRVDVGVQGKAFGELFRFPDLTQWANPKVWITAFTLAIVASLETLLSVEASDKLDPERRKTPSNRELLAQGIGNTLSGFIGGLPVTQVVVRTSANVNSGGRTKLSTILHGFLIAGAIVAIPGLLNQIPYASLAAILITVGYKLTKPSLIISVLREGWLQFVPFALTVVFVVVSNLLEGVAIGFASAVLLTWLQRLRARHPGGRPSLSVVDDGYVLKLPGFVSFFRKAAIVKLLSQVPRNADLTILTPSDAVIHSDVKEILADGALERNTRTETF
jgi:MFS superfamily sulfate permease-like transporter